MTLVFRKKVVQYLIMSPQNEPDQQAPQPFDNTQTKQEIISQLPQKNQVNKILIIIIIFFTFLTLIFGGYYFLTNKQEKLQTAVRPSQVLQPTLQPSLEQAPSILPDEFAGWKIYKDDRNGYSFKYPTNLVIKTEKELDYNSGENSIFFIDSNKVLPENATLDDAIITIGNFIVTDNTDNIWKNAREYFDSIYKITPQPRSNYNFNNPGTIKLKNYMIDGHQAYETYSGGSLGSRFPKHYQTFSRNIEILKDDSLVIRFATLVYDDRLDETAIDEIFDKILFTFRFIDSEITSPTYVNDEYKFSFTYKRGENVVVCPNKSEGNDNVAVWIGEGQNAECATEGPYQSIYVSKKNNYVNSIDDHVRQLQASGNDYTITKQPVSVSGVSGYRIIGSRDPSIPAPIPDNIDEYVFSKNGILYIIDQSYFNRNFQILN